MLVDSVQHPYVTGFTKLNNNPYPHSRKAIAHKIKSHSFSGVMNLFVCIKKRAIKIFAADISFV
jgi:hypothetical protein